MCYIIQNSWEGLVTSQSIPMFWWIFFWCSQYSFAFYHLTLNMLFYGNSSHLIAILFPDWPNTDNLVVFEKMVSKIKVKRTKFYCVGHLVLKIVLVEYLVMSKSQQAIYQKYRLQINVQYMSLYKDFKWSLRVLEVFNYMLFYKKNKLFLLFKTSYMVMWYSLMCIKMSGGHYHIVLLYSDSSMKWTQLLLILKGIINVSGNITVPWGSQFIINITSTYM